MMIDSNIWIAYLYTDDALHERAVRFVEQTAERPLIVFEYQVVETVTLLARCSGKALADSFLNALRNSNEIKIMLSSPELFGAIAHCYKNHAQRALSFADYALLYLSQSTTVATFDTKLRNAIKRDKGKYYDGAI